MTLHGLAQLREILSCLPNSSRRKLWVLLTLILCRATIEVAGVASAYPLFAILAQPDAFPKSAIGKWLMTVTSVVEPSTLLLPVVAIYALLLAASALAAALITIQQYRFIYALQTELSTRLLAGYLSKPYEFFIQRNAAVLAKNINISAAEFSAGLVLYGLFFVSSALILAALILVLMLFSPFVTLAAGALLAAIYATIIFLLRPRIAGWGQERDAQLSGMFKCVEEALTGVRDVKVSGSEAAFLNRFKAHSVRYARLNIRFQAANTAPSQLAQATVMALVAAILFVLSARGVLPATVIPMLGVFYIAFSRMLPLGNQLYTNWVTIAYFWPTIGIVHEGILEAGSAKAAGGQAAAAEDEVVAFDKALTFEQVDYRYPTANEDAICGFAFDVRFGQQVALVGRSGAGKSTTLDLLLGLIHPSAGEIRIDGVRLTPERVPAWRRQIGYVPQHLFLFDASLAENIAFGVPYGEIDYRRLEEAVAGASLTALVSRLPEGVQTPVGDRGLRLSGGERQRVGIARALYRRPKVLVLDEATSALDAETERAILSELARLKGQITTIVVTHRLETLRDCDAIVRLESGRNATDFQLPPGEESGGSVAGHRT